MSTYVIGDLHGCYDVFMSMLDLIKFSNADKLYMVGDYVDRGTQTHLMLRWLEDKPENVFPVKGNHDVEFVAYVELMCSINAEKKLDTDLNSSDAFMGLYRQTKEYIKRKRLHKWMVFDYYDTLKNLADRKMTCFGELCRWAKMLADLPYYYRFPFNDRDCVVAHAGFKEDHTDTLVYGTTQEEFCLYARDEGLTEGGIKNGTIIFGHTPTIAPGTRVYTDGQVFRYYDCEKDCNFIDVDCGCVYSSDDPSAALACIRFEDEEVFYV